jgi:PAS domain S-box-containing protein/diguanylate cyclase (GGDEF)-like protein
MGVFVSPEDRESFVETIRMHGRVDGVEAEVRKKSGEIATMLGSSELINLAGEPHLLNIMLDITDKKHAEGALKESEGRFRNAFEASAIGMALVGLDGRLLKVNRSLCESVGYAEDELLAKTFQDLTHPDDLEKDREQQKRLIEDEIPYYHIEKRYLHRDGYNIWVLLCVSMVRDARGYPLYFVCQIEDITERKLLEEKLHAALITDELTGLYNRRGFFERSDEELWSAPRRGETALLFLVKLDDMKRINDIVGHKAGDAIITNVGRMLQETFRGQDVIGRIGGVEFAILATGTEETVNRHVAHLEKAASTFEKSDGRSCPVSLSVGTALSRPHEARSLEELIARANETMMGEEQAEGSACPTSRHQS